jgi:hypothetical protein
MPENENLMPIETGNTMKSLVEETKKQRAMYPEIHYKLHPFVCVTCDAIEATGRMPTQEEFDGITDNIYDEFCKMHPDMENYMKSGDKDDPPEAVTAFDGFGRGFGRGFGFMRRRGIGRDLVGALLLAELLGRRRYNHPYWPY